MTALFHSAPTSPWLPKCPADSPAARERAGSKNPMRTRDRDRMLRRADEAEEKARKDFRRSLRATKATNGMGTIYFIGPPDRDVVKIGWTSGSPYRRLKNIQSGNHTHLELLAAIAGTKEEERRLHDYFSFALY